MEEAVDEVYLANTTADTGRFTAEDGRLYISTEVQERDGNVTRSRVNPAQFWNKLPYSLRGLMDPCRE